MPEVLDGSGPSAVPSGPPTPADAQAADAQASAAGRAKSIALLQEGQTLGNVLNILAHGHAPEQALTAAFNTAFNATPAPWPGLMGAVKGFVLGASPEHARQKEIERQRVERDMKMDSEMAAHLQKMTPDAQGKLIAKLGLLEQGTGDTTLKTLAARLNSIALSVHQKSGTKPSAWASLRNDWRNASALKRTYMVTVYPLIMTLLAAVAVPGIVVLGGAVAGRWLKASVRSLLGTRPAE